MESLGQFYRGGGWVLPVLVGIAAVGGLLVLERFTVLVVRSTINGRQFIEHVIRLARAGKLEDAIQHCARSSAVLADMGLLILRTRTRDEGALRRVADAAALAIMPRLTRRLGLLPALASAALLVGALGTLVSVQRAFWAAASLGPAERGGLMASGVADALDWLALGLIVAIALSLAHAWLEEQAAATREQADEFSVRLINALTDRPDVRLGHR